MKIKLRAIWCYIVGHDMIELERVDNGHSIYGSYKCLRCGKVESWQYDFA